VLACGSIASVPKAPRNWAGDGDKRLRDWQRLANARAHRHARSFAAGVSPYRGAPCFAAVLTRGAQRNEGDRGHEGQHCYNQCR
jgi:hypothetical protein